MKYRRGLKTALLISFLSIFEMKSILEARKESSATQLPTGGSVSSLVSSRKCEQSDELERNSNDFTSGQSDPEEERQYNAWLQREYNKEREFNDWR